MLLLLVACAHVPDLAPVDYADASSWICRPDVDGPCDDVPVVDVAPDGTLSSSTSSKVATDVDCFYVYPTVDLRLRMGLHEDLDDRGRMEDVTVAQAARLHEECNLWAPAYRQMTIGTYFHPKRMDAFLDAAYADVDAAFDDFLAEVPADHGIVVLGHSQGGEMVGKLLKDRFDADPGLRARLVVAAPIGWPVSSASWENVPLCAGDDDTGCAIGYRSFSDGHTPPSSTQQRFEDGPVACRNPATSTDDLVPLSGAVLPADRVHVDGVPKDARTLVRWKGVYSARCVDVDGQDGAGDGDRALAVSWTGDGKPPVDLDQARYTGAMGTHVLDLSLPQDDVLATIARRADAWRAKQ